MRKAGLVIGCIAVLCLSFWISLNVIDYLNLTSLSDSQDVDPGGTFETEAGVSLRAVRPISVRELPQVPPGAPYPVGWDGIEGLDAKIVGAAPIPGGGALLSLVATRNAGRHRLGMGFSGIPPGQPMQATAWVKVPTGTYVSMDIRDTQGSGPSRGTFTFDPRSLKTLSSAGPVKTSLQAGPGEWTKITLQVASGDGGLVVYVGLVGRAGASEFTGEGQQMLFGGIVLTPV